MLYDAALAVQLEGERLVHLYHHLRPTVNEIIKVNVNKLLYRSLAEKSNKTLRLITKSEVIYYTLASP